MSLMANEHCFHGLTPAVKTAEFPPSNISSSSSSVVAFPAKVDTNKKSLPRTGDNHTVARLCCQLTDLQLPSDAAFALVPEVHLGLVVLSHHLHKLLGQDGLLRERRTPGVPNLIILSVFSCDFSFVWPWRLLVTWIWNQVSFFRPVRTGQSLYLQLFVQPEGNLPWAKTRKKSAYCNLVM